MQNSQISRWEKLRFKTSWKFGPLVPRQMRVRFQLWQLRARLADASQAFRTACDDAFRESFRYELLELENQFEVLDTWRLECLSKKYGILIPHSDNAWWIYSKDFGTSHLSHEGKSKLQELIRQERNGRVQRWVPILTAIVGVLGALIGLLSMLLPN
jgi:hypothetical protein